MNSNKSNLRIHDELSEILTGKIKEADKKGISAGLLCISIDNMPMILSSQGDFDAENIIGELISYISRLISKHDVVLRGGQDQISVILMDYSPQGMRDKALEIRKEIQDYGCTHAIRPIQIMSTIGCVNIVETNKTAHDAINKAYIAVNEAKENLKHYVEYGNHEKHERESKNQMILATYLQNAFLKNKLCMAYQPIIDAKTGDISYYEALLRIVNDDGSTSSAGPFIPIAEKMGFIDVIDSLVLQLVTAELENSPNVKLALNISNASMYDSNWLEMAVKVLSNVDIASRLVVEITETAEAQNQRKMLNFINTLQGLGCEIALDDFGNGYTSFAQLKVMPVDIIKIDGSFIKDITVNKENRFFVKTLLDLGSGFGLKTVAEFVENGEIAKVLMDMDVDYMQGNYFSPALNYRSWLSDTLPA